MKLLRSIVLAAGCGFVAGCSFLSSHVARPGVPAKGAVTQEQRDLGRFFQGVDGTFVLLDARASHIIVHNPDRARAGFLPASTYKIPHTLIALETGEATGHSFTMAWDSAVAPRRAWWPAVWARDHTLDTALRYSVVWYYQELARRIGPARMQAYLDRFAYGNRILSGGIEQFWLTGGLRVSPAEQVDFLRRFYFQELGLSERTTRIAKDLLVLEETFTYRLSGKTGWAGLGEESAPQVGWLVGYLERDEQVYFFATNIDINTSADAAARLAITTSILRDLGLIE